MRNVVRGKDFMLDIPYSSFCEIQWAIPSGTDSRCKPTVLDKSFTISATATPKFLWERILRKSQSVHVFILSILGLLDEPKSVYKSVEFILSVSVITQNITFASFSDEQYEYLMVAWASHSRKHTWRTIIYSNILHKYNPLWFLSVGDVIVSFLFQEPDAWRENFVGARVWPCWYRYTSCGGERTLATKKAEASWHWKREVCSGSVEMEEWVNYQPNCFSYPLSQLLLN